MDMSSRDDEAIPTPPKPQRDEHRGSRRVHVVLLPDCMIEAERERPASQEPATNAAATPARPGRSSEDSR
jgi:hypothetical protein